MSDAHDALIRLRAAIESTQLPEKVRRAWTSAPPPPVVGQVWAARWGSYYQYLLLLDVTANAVRAAPVTFDAALADTDAMVVDIDLGVSSIPVAIWFPEESALPIRVLDRYAGITVKQPRDLGGDRGEPIVSALDRRSRYRARLQDALETFASARWDPDSDGSLQQLIAVYDAALIVAALQISEREFVYLRRGQRPVTLDEARLLAPIVGRTAEQVLAANPALPEALVADLDLPEHRALVVQAAQRQGLDELDAWRAAGYAVLAASHRAAGREPPSWRTRIHQYFEATLGD